MNLINHLQELHGLIQYFIKSAKFGNEDQFEGWKRKMEDEGPTQFIQRHSKYRGKDGRIKRFFSCFQVKHNMPVHMEDSEQFQKIGSYRCTAFIQVRQIFVGR